MGHVTGASACVRQLKLDKLYLVPAGVPPHKTLPEGSATGGQRLDMTRLLAQLIPNAEVCDLEIYKREKCYTVDTLRQLARRHPGDDLWLVVGTDMFLSFENWHQPEEISRLVRLAAVSRDGTPPEALLAHAQKLEERFGTKTDIVQNQVVEVSSTEIRQGELCTQVPDGVAAYIRRHGLYQPEPFKPDLVHLRAYAKRMLNEQRYRHTLGCEEMAAQLARKYGIDETKARAAAILHDVTKCQNFKRQLQLCEKYHIILFYTKENEKKLLHADTGAAVAQHEFAMPPDVVQAISRHTIGAPDMSVFDKVLFAADACESSRDYDGLAEIRAALGKGLDECLIASMQNTMDHLRGHGVTPEKQAEDTLHWLKKRVRENDGGE